MAENVFFSVSASGVQLNYQWLKNGTNLPATDARILTLNNVSRRDSGTYAVRVSNPGGSILSSNAFLRVRVPQRLGAIERFEDGTFQLTSSDVDNGQVSVDDLTFFEAQYSTNLADWISLPGALQLTNGRLRVLDAPGGDDSMRFYRVIEH